MEKYFYIWFRNFSRFEGNERKQKENLVNWAEKSVFLSLKSGVPIKKKTWDHKDNACRQHSYQGVSENLMYLNIGLHFEYMGSDLAISADDESKSTNSQKHFNKCHSSGLSRFSKPIDVNVNICIAFMLNMSDHLKISANFESINI